MFEISGSYFSWRHTVHFLRSKVSVGLFSLFMTRSTLSPTWASTRLQAGGSSPTASKRSLAPVISRCYTGMSREISLHFPIFNRNWSCLCRYFVKITHKLSLWYSICFFGSFFWLRNSDYFLVPCSFLRNPPKEGKHRRMTPHNTLHFGGIVPRRCESSRRAGLVVETRLPHRCLLQDDSRWSWTHPFPQLST